MASTVWVYKVTNVRLYLLLSICGISAHLDATNSEPVFCRLLALHNRLYSNKRGFEVVEQDMLDALLHAEPVQVVLASKLLFDEEHIGMTRSAQIAYSVAEEERERRVRETAVGQDCLALVMSEAGGRVAVLDGPCAVGVEVDVVRDDVDLLLVLAEKVGEHGADRGFHTARDDDYGDVVRFAELIEVLESGV